MAVDVSYPVGLRDIKVYPISSLATPTYGSGVDCPAAASLEISLTFSDVVAEGDDTTISSFSNPTGCEWTLECSTGLSLPALEVIYGSTATDSGSSPSQVSDYAFNETRKAPWFGCIGRAVDAESDGDVHMVLYKCKATTGPGGALAYQSYKPIQISGKALSTPYTAYAGTLWRIVHHETSVAIPTTWPGGAGYVS